MPDLSEYHPDFLKNWPDRLFEYFLELSDVTYQEDVWVHAKRPDTMDDFVEFVCGLFDDEDVMSFLDLYQSELNPEVHDALIDAVHRVEQFSDSLDHKESYHPENWISSPEWQACIRSGQRVVAIISDVGWFRNDSDLTKK